ncbi:hypothetical protein [Thioclava pacifica]|uniref:Glyceraldehyde-3-phosphate dehydrogenase n=1 Tax=Thioclava pacifica DSM 10166 TaxID=1353537 RepID=A0A074J504_9RHOB|nr:hypothetical protein [Thioclava pacifica]KEO51589.1 hypothetical protein TP2_11885 [Thioclava pacifica DSM 10166]
MTNRIALWLAGIIIVLIFSDVLFDGGRILLFLAKELLDLVQYIAFWR